MDRKQSITLGVNQQFLYIEAMTDADAHTKTLSLLAKDARVEALDCWVWASHRAEETRILRDCGKWINYNIGDRAGAKPVAPASPDEALARYSMDVMRNEIDMALECGAKKIIIGSGPDFPEDRAAAMDRFLDFTLQLMAMIPRDVQLTIEPTDTDIDKRFLLGSLEDTNELVRRVRQEGYQNFGVLIDMGHIPLLRERIPDAVDKVRDTIMHVHLGNAVMRDPGHPLYGDKHPAWNIAGGEYDESDVVTMLRSLKHIGYIRPGEKPTITFEMRVFEGKSPDESLSEFIRIFDDSWRQLFDGA